MLKPLVYKRKPPRVRAGFLLASLALILVAFLALGGNRFTPLNVTLWLLSILCFCPGVLAKGKLAG